MDSTFTPLYDLFSLTEEQRAAYILALNKHMRLDPALSLIRLTKMDSDSGQRLVPYIGKGGTDILRDTWEIDVTEMIQHDGPGYVSFTAVGKNKKGRVDRAVGAAATEGLRGAKLADAVATAQTKASRRLTLQFVGAGVLDESEVQSTTQMTELPSSQAQLAGSPVVLPQAPTAVPSAAPGKDITQPSFAELVKAAESPIIALAEVLAPAAAADYGQSKMMTHIDEVKSECSEKCKCGQVCGRIDKHEEHECQKCNCEKQPVTGDPDYDMGKKHSRYTHRRCASFERPSRS